MAKKLFVGGLSWNTTSEQLKAAFATIGAVTDAVVITDRETGRSRGFGFVTYGNDADADRALADLNGTMLDGRALKIDAATERAPGGPRMGGGGGPGGPRSFGGGGGGGGFRGGPPGAGVGAGRPPRSFGGGGPGGPSNLGPDRPPRGDRPARERGGERWVDRGPPKGPDRRNRDDDDDRKRRFEDEIDDG